ncbi:unnamed protein product [Cyclocybe aegerita]|uniref:F-box domain-containing protein n=1 Tax=Cyclocybe aegerita TaxID=1973307 RepID=A0A8S0VWY9_CYCAE|nr:unnamed protein product [Cyclocybe aegerita]
MARPTGVDSIPNELLENIFEVGLLLPIPMDDNYPHRPLFSKSPLLPLYPTALSQVCIRWRELVLQMPNLWSHIHLTRSIEAHRRLKSEVRRSLEWLPTYFIRSAGLPLHVTVDTTRLPATTVLNLILPHSARWQSFTLLVSHIGSLPSILPLLEKTRVPQLRTLSISSDIYRDGIVSYEPLSPFFAVATPELSSVHLHGVYILWNAAPLKNLRTLELHFTSRWPTFTELRDVLLASPQLRRFVIHDDITELLRHVDQPLSKPKIELGSLKYLEIEAYRVRGGHADVASLIGLFTLPRVETLVLRELKTGEWTNVAMIYGLPADPRKFQIRPSRRSTDYRASVFRVSDSFPFLSTLIVSSSSFSGGATH